MEDWLQWKIAAIRLLITVALRAEVALLFLGAGAIGVLYYGNLLRQRSTMTIALAAASDWLTALIGLALLGVLFRWKVSNPLLMLQRLRWA
jgi:chromate transporter